jgi:hypothetical protein
VVAGAAELGAVDLAPPRLKRFDEDEAVVFEEPPSPVNNEPPAGADEAGVVEEVDPRLNMLLGAEDAGVVEDCVAGALDAEGKLKVGLVLEVEVEVVAAGPDVAGVFKPENSVLLLVAPPELDVGAAGLFPNKEGPPVVPVFPKMPPPA